MTGHPCPGGCGRENLPVMLLACAWCWAVLPRRLRTRVRVAWRTENHAAHQAAVRDAVEWFTANPLPTGVIR